MVGQKIAAHPTQELQYYLSMDSSSIVLSFHQARTEKTSTPG